MSLKISIITVCYNSGRTIEDTLKSILAQSYKQIEIIIIDGGSTDNTIEIINKYQHFVTYFSSEEDQGLYDAMNKGLKASTGDIIGILNSDDLYAYDTYIEDVANTFTHYKNADLVYSDLVYVDYENKKILRQWIAGKYGKYSFRLGWMPPHPTVFVKKEVYSACGGFNTKLRFSADYEFLLRVFERYNRKMAYLPKIGVRMRMGGVSNGSFQNRLKANKEDRIAWKINHLKPWPFTVYLKPVRKIVQYKLLK